MACTLVSGCVRPRGDEVATDMAGGLHHASLLGASIMSWRQLVVTCDARVQECQWLPSELCNHFGVRCASSTDAYDAGRLADVGSTPPHRPRPHAHHLRHHALDLSAGRLLRTVAPAMGRWAAAPAWVVERASQTSKLGCRASCSHHTCQSFPKANEAGEITMGTMCQV